MRFITLTKHADSPGVTVEHVTISVEHIVSMRDGYVVGKPQGGTLVTLSKGDVLHVEETRAEILAEIQRMRESELF